MNETTTTTTNMPSPASLKRCAILGTAQSWKQCPFQDQTLEVWGLNDGYLLGVPRANRWYDLHPFHQMYFRPPGERAVGSSSWHEVPTGAYLRPSGHLEWLKTRPIPVYLAEARSDWPTSRAFPKDAILDFFKPYWPWRLTRRGTVEPGPDYEVSTPSWMLMHAIVEGYTEIHVYGIHLATEWEYVQQRPNFEWLLGIAGGLGIKIVLPESTPICKAAYRYAFEPKADIPFQEAQRRIQQIKADGATLQQRHAQLPWYASAQKADVRARLEQLHVELLDARQEASRVQATLR